MLGKNSLTERINYRGKLPKQDKTNKDYIKFLKNKKLKYSLHNNENADIGDMFNLLKKVGGKNGR